MQFASAVIDESDGSSFVFIGEDVTANPDQAATRVAFEGLSADGWDIKPGPSTAGVVLVFLQR